SGGAGKKEDFLELFKAGVADAGLAASVFHFKEINIKELKEYLKANEIEMRV
ncbi:MAG: imidazole glycerol phosphate synthase subunit HisF, partial [Clostridia bacterium]|nr:imidazole glycerol phosphate synthase subunit HisF [Clostridia bacterium]